MHERNILVVYYVSICFLDHKLLLFDFRHVGMDTAIQKFTRLSALPGSTMMAIFHQKMKTTVARSVGIVLG